MLILSKESKKEFSQRKLETYDRYNRVINWGRKYPVDFAEWLFGIEMLDYQAYALEASWTKQFILWLICRNGAKTTTDAFYAMLRSILLPYNVSYFLGNTGEQAKEVFTKLEKIAKRQIESFVGLTDVFYNEIRVDSPVGDGFVHLPASFSVKLFNGSEIYTLNSDIVNIKGKRANNVFFDESAWFSDEMFTQAENFANQDENFKLGGSVNMALEPRNFPRQLIYSSSASDTDSEFYKKFRLFSEEMFKGNPNYFVCNFDIDAVMSATVKGDKLVVPLISKDKVEKAMADNLEKAQRELYNKFSADAHEGQILTRRDLRQHTRPYLPELANTTGKKQYVFSWDSARLNDNSVIEVAELINDPKIGYKMRLVNVNSLVDVKNKNKTPMIFPKQADEFKRMLLAYNGTEFGKLDYENIDAVVCDAGAGGQIIGGVTDYLLEDWTGPDGKKHRGLIDTRHKANTTSRESYPNAIDKVKLVDPRANRNLIFKAIEDMVKLGVVEFPAEYDVTQDFVAFIDDDGNEVKHELTVEEQIALTQIELTKTEIVTMCKYVSNGSESYNYPADKRNKMHDDRVFAFGLLCFHLAQLRRGQIVEKKPEEENVIEKPTTVSTVEM